MASLIRTIFLGLVLTFCFYCSLAQPGVGPGGGPPGGGGNPGGGTPVPITGIEILLIAGGALGFKRFIASKKSKNS